MLNDRDRLDYFTHDGVRLAYRRTIGDAHRVGLVWLGGFHSDMTGEKASALHAAAQADDRSFLRFDYFGHGASEGDFAAGTIGRWRGDALGALDALTSGPVVLCGSSMGSWMAILAALARPERVRALLLLAPAPDFTDKLMWAQLPESARRDILENGAWKRPSPYDPGGYPITRALIEDGRSWNVMDAPIPIAKPVTILQGRMDEDVPLAHALDLAARLTQAEPLTMRIVRDGDHRLSRPQDISLMIGEALALAKAAD